MWISDSEKYALVGLGVKLKGSTTSGQVAPALWVLIDPNFEVPSHWREWLGSIRAEEVAQSNLFLVSKIASKTAEILDGENQELECRVWYFYVGMLLSAMFSPSHKPVLLTGARVKNEIDIRQHRDLDVPVPQTYRPYPSIFAEHILQAAALGSNLYAMRQNPVPGGFWRLYRTLDIYIKCRTTADILERIHQYCRCVDGLILPVIGKTKHQFKSKTELFIGASHHELMGKLYDIRSHVEHLHENRYLEEFDREARLDLVKKEAILEYVVRTALARIIGQKSLWEHFGNVNALEAFWAGSPDVRQRLWGNTINPLTPLANFKPQYLHDSNLR